MKKFAVLTLMFVCFLANGILAGEQSNTKSVILINIYLEDKKELIKTEIPVNHLNDEGGIAIGGGGGQGHCYDSSPKCSYSYSGVAYRRSEQRIDVKLTLNFGKKWKKCNVKKNFVVDTEKETKFNLNCNMKITAKHIPFTPEKN